MKLIVQNYYKIILFLIFVSALFLRWIYLPSGAISFAYDQARDAFVVQSLLSGDLKLLGPSVSGVPGLFHGVLYYYVIAPAYLIGQGNPIVVAFWLSFLSSLVVYVVYKLAYLLTKDKTPALISALIFAFSFETSQYANLLTNASMGVWFVPLLYIGLYIWITENNSKNKNTFRKFAPALTGVSLGFSIQSELALAYHMFPLLVWLFIYRKEISKKQIAIFGIAFFISIVSMVIAEIKFGYTGLSGVLYLLLGGDGIVQSKNLSDYLITILDQSGKTFAYTIFPINVVLGGVLGFLMITISVALNLKEIKKKFISWETFLISYIFAYTIALPFGGWNMRHILVGVSPAIAIFLGIFIWKYFRNITLVFYLIILTILFSNAFVLLKENKNGQTIFPLQLGLTLANEMKTVDYSYQKAKGENFSISTLTSPLFTNTLWSYVYNWYGVKKYGYLPSWYGKNQVGQLGDNLIFDLGGTKKHFFIIEPTYGIPELYVGYAKGEQESTSKFISEEAYEGIIIQEREMYKK